LALSGTKNKFMEVFFHTFTDALLFFGWFFANLKIIFTSILSFADYIFIVLGHFLSSISLTPPEPQLTYTFTADVLAVFNSIPNWAIISTILGVVIVLAGGIAILKLFLHT
jgi:hypothetical protein